MQVGRKPSATVVPLGLGHQPRPEIPRPPHWLSSEERKLFKELVKSASHLTISDIPLLCNYVQASVAVRDLVLIDVADWARVSRQLSMMANQLRLTAVSRVSAYELKKDGDKPRTVRPWE